MKLGNSKDSLMKNFEHKIHFTIAIIQTNNYYLMPSKIKRTILTPISTNQKSLLGIQKEDQIQIQISQKDTRNHLT